MRRRRGLFLDTISRMLRIPVAELGPLSLKATRAHPLSSTCAVFAESEVLSLVHRKPPVPIPRSWQGFTSRPPIACLASRSGWAWPPRS